MSIPRRDDLLDAYGANFDRQATAAPERFGLTAEMAARFRLAYRPFAESLSKLLAARAAGDWSQSMTGDRDAAKAALLACARTLYHRVRASSDVSDANKILLGVHVPARRGSPVPPPSVRPAARVVSQGGRAVGVQISPAAGNGRSGRVKRPDGATCAWVYFHVGDDYPSDERLWQFRGGVTRGTLDVKLAPDVPPGSRVWVCARYVNRKQQPGPMAPPVHTHVGGGVAER